MLRSSGRRSVRTGRVMLLVLAIGLVPLSVGAAAIEHQSTGHARAELDTSLANAAATQSDALENYFAQARSTLLVTAQNPAFRAFYDLPGSRTEKLKRGGPVVEAVNEALAYVDQLYQDSISEACFIDRAGPENARVVRGERAPLHHLAPDESGNPFFAPTMALSHGQVHQARPYVSPDTGEWVIANSTLMPTADGAKRAIVHFEVTIESFRTAAAKGSRFPLAIVDANTGKSIMDSRFPQRRGAPLGPRGDRGFGLLKGRTGSGTLTVGGQRIAFQRVASKPGNANAWLVVTSSAPITSSFFANSMVPLGLLALALLVLAFAMARRWVGVTTDLDERQKDLRVSEKRYRELFEEAEGARQTLAVQNEQLRELDRLKDEFVALVSHELRTPLTSISGYLELVLESESGALTDEQRQFLLIVDRNADRLLRLVGDLLFMAQVGAGSYAIQREDVDLAELAESCVDSARLIAQEKGIDLSVAADPLPPVPGDRSRLGQLLDNLVSNALKFTPPDGRVNVRVARVNGRGVVAVSDTGMGIPHEEQARLFERFYRTTAASTNAVPGTGLGLAIAKAIVDAHGGQIECTSREGMGTTFRVSFPLEVPASEPGKPHAVAAKADS